MVVSSVSVSAYTHINDCQKGLTSYVGRLRIRLDIVLEFFLHCGLIRSAKVNSFCCLLF